MPIPLSRNSSFDYVLKAERDLPREQQTIFKCKYLTVDEMAEVEDALGSFDSSTNEMRVKVGSQVVKILRLGLVGWLNFKHPDGTEAQFVIATNGKTKGSPTNATLDMLSPADRRELANAITESNRVSETEKGKSESSLES